MDSRDGDGIDRLRLLCKTKKTTVVTNWRRGAYNDTLSAYGPNELFAGELPDQFITYALRFTIYFATNYQNILCLKL